MPRGSEKVNEFKRYRQALAALYIAATGAGFLLLAASVARELFFRPVVQLPGQLQASMLPAQKPDPNDLLRCHDDVASLLGDLDRITVELIAKPRATGETDRLKPAWEAFSQQWLMRWDSVNAWCRFAELAGRDIDIHMGEAYERMAEIHADLPAMRLKYQSLLVRFDDDQAVDLARMQRQLDRVKTLLQHSAAAKGEEAP